MAKLRRDLEEAGLKFGEQLATLKKKGADAVQELSDQVEQLQKQKNRAEKEKAQVQREFDEASTALDQEAKARAEQERIAKQHEVLGFYDSFLCFLPLGDAAGLFENGRRNGKLGSSAYLQ